MSKISLGILVAAVLLIVLGVMFDVAFVQGGSGVVLIVGLGYSYVVAKREVELLSFAATQRKAEQEDDEDDALLLVELAQ